MADNAGRCVFNKLYEELCLLANKKLERMGIWHWLSEAGFRPESLTQEEALRFLERRGERYLSQLTILGPPTGRSDSWSWQDLERLAKVIEHWNPRTKTPEEILERICNGLFGRSSGS